MVNIYTGSNTVEHFLGGVTKCGINTMFRTSSKHGYSIIPFFYRSSVVISMFTLMQSHCDLVFKFDLVYVIVSLCI